MILLKCRSVPEGAPRRSAQGQLSLNVGVKVVLDIDVSAREEKGGASEAKGIGERRARVRGNIGRLIVVV